MTMLPVTQTVTNFDPKIPLGDCLQTFGYLFCKYPAIIHSCAVRKCVSIPLTCFTLPEESSSPIKSVKIHPTCNIISSRKVPISIFLYIYSFQA